jgi:hypothetical protein
LINNMISEITARCLLKITHAWFHACEKYQESMNTSQTENYPHLLPSVPSVSSVVKGFFSSFSSAPSSYSAVKGFFSYFPSVISVSSVVKDFFLSFPPRPPRTLR